MYSYQKKNVSAPSRARQSRSRVNPFFRAAGKQLGAFGKQFANNVTKSAANYASKKFLNYAAPLAAQALVGMGDYKVKTVYGNHISPHGYRANTYKARQYGAMNKAANVTKLEKGEMRIVHSEYIGDLISSGTTGAVNFTSQSYGINPGNSGTFPWLSATAVNFQDYKFKKLVFEYRPLVSESTATTSATLTSMGAVIMATQYDSSLGPYATKSIMENADFTVSSKPSSQMVHAIECKPKFNPLGTLYVSPSQGTTNSGQSNSDIRMQNLGIFQIASSNIPIASNTPLDLGEIWVHYDIELYKPQLNAGLVNLLSGHWTNNASTGAAATNTPFGPNVTSLIQPTQKNGTQLNCTFSSNGTITFPLSVTEGSFLVMYYLVGSAVTLGAVSFTAVQACSIQPIFTNDGAGLQAPQSALAGTTNFCVGGIVNVNAPGSQLAQIQLVTATIPTAGAYDVIITPWNSAIVS